MSLCIISFLIKYCKANNNLYMIIDILFSYEYAKFCSPIIFFVLVDDKLIT